MRTTAGKAALPPDVLRAVRAGSRLVLITGAGCSVENPTNLPLGCKMSADAHEQLVADTVLSEGDCSDKENLSLLADVVYAAKGSLAELVRRLPLDEMRAATPNRGHLAAAALLRERALASIVTLNYDHAFPVAVSQLGGGREVSIVTGPGDHEHLADPCVIYIHGTAFSDPEDWILRTQDLEKWTDTQWRAVIAARVLSPPVVVFAGLGSRADVLTDTLARIRTGIPNGVRVFQVDPAERERSAFAEALNIDDDGYVRMGWCQFMAGLAGRLVREHVAEIAHKATSLIDLHSWEAEDTSPLVAALEALPLDELGRLRAAWLLDPKPYVPRNQAQVAALADLSLALVLIARKADATWTVREGGFIEFRNAEGRTLGTLMFASGASAHRWLSLEAAVRQRSADWTGLTPTAVILSGYVGGVADPAAPPSIISDEDENSILAEPTYPRLVAADILRAESTKVKNMVFS